MPSPSRSLALVLATVVLAAGLAGCMQPELGPRPNVDVPTDGPRGHALKAAGVRTTAATLTGAVEEDLPTGGSRFVLGREVRSIAEHRAVIFHAAQVGSKTGVLVALPSGDLVLNGPIGYRASAFTLTPEATLRQVQLDPDVKARVQTSEGLQRALDEAGFGKDAFFGDGTTLRLRGAVEVRATRIVLVTEGGAEELGGSALVEFSGPIVSTVDLSRSSEPTTLRLTVTGSRGMLTLANASGKVELDDRERVVTLEGHAAIALASGTSVALAPSSVEENAPHVFAGAEGRAFQVYANGGAQVPARLVLSLESDSAAVGSDETRKVRFSLKNADPNTDAVITNVDIRGAPDDAVRLPGFRLLTEEFAEAAAGNPVAMAAFVAAAPALIIADAFRVILEAIFGPPQVPQMIEAGTTFTSELGVSKPSGPFDATITFEGNFEATSATLRVS